MSERFTERAGRPPSMTSPPTPREVEDEIAERRPMSHRSRAIRGSPSATPLQEAG